MYIIGERINGMFKNVKEAILAQDKSVIQELALTQMEHGADCLDVNVGPATRDQVGAMEWLVKTINEVGEFPLSIDSPKPDVIEAGLKNCRVQPIINSTTADPEVMNKLLPMAKKYNSRVIGLTIDENGVPGTAEGRTEVALKFLAACMEHEIEIEDIFIDPIILPVNAAQDVPKRVLEAIHSCKMLSDPAPAVILGLSNVSQKCNNRKLINRTYLVMAMAMGLSACILDPFDDDLMDAMITARLLLNEDIYCDSFLEAYRQKHSTAKI
ncbi:MAG: dihydropteroate synthase [Chloroflexi bacterium]|nr:dihydropteroate synthase [Chloroflexota bacterium]